MWGSERNIALKMAIARAPDRHKRPPRAWALGVAAFAARLDTRGPPLYRGNRAAVAADSRMALDEPRRVLLVDDEPALVRVYARALSAEGYEVDVASDGADALLKLRERTYDVVVTDICMPRMSGLRLLEGIRRFCPDVPAVLMTARLDPETYERARELGSVRYLLKPFKLEQLSNAVQSAAKLREVWQRMSRRRALNG